MFKKKPNIKPLAPLRSSDRRKTADSIIADLGLEPQKHDESDPEAKAAAVAALTNLRNSLLPDNALSAKFTTTTGPDLRQVSGTVYVGTHPGDEQRALWIKLEDNMFPTVYTLWHNPSIVPLLHTPGFVVSKIQGGADLMTPGLARGPPFPEKAKKGAVVAVASLDSPSVPVAVGVCEIDISALQQVQGAKGHAVQTLHWAGDELWGWQPANKPPGTVPKHLEGWDDQVEDQELADQTGGMNLNGEEQGGVQLEQPAQTLGGPQTVSADKDDEDEEPDEPEVELTQKDIDNAFFKAFLYGVHQQKQSNKDHPTFGLQFPLTQSFIMSTLVQPFLPAFTPQQQASLQIKKSSWKNIKKFVKHLDKQRIVKSKDRDGNEVVILDIDFDDQAISDFKPYRLPKKETAACTALGRGDKATGTIAPDASDTSIGQTLTLKSLYRPSSKFSPIFSTTESSTKTLFTSPEIRPLINTYIESENLISPTNKRLVTLNPTLANAVFDGSHPLDKEVLAKGSVPRDALIDRIIASCSAFYLLTSSSPPSNAPEAKPKSGNPPKVHITLETRSGNKTVTKVSGLEQFYINPTALAEELRKTCASSTSVDQLMGSSPKNPVMEVLVQGPQRDAVGKALERRGVSRGWIEVTDKTKGKKK